MNEKSIATVFLPSGHYKFEIKESAAEPFNDTVAILNLKLAVTTSDQDSRPEEVIINMLSNNVMPNSYTQLMLSAIRQGALMPDYEGNYLNEYLVGTTGEVYLCQTNGIWAATGWQFNPGERVAELGVW